MQPVPAKEERAGACLLGWGRAVSLAGRGLVPAGAWADQEAGGGVCGGVGAGRNILLVLGLHAHPSPGPGWFGGAVPQWLDSRFGLAETPALTLTGCGSVAGGQSPASSFALGP